MKFGLIGYPLSHSFSKEYFTSKFASLGLGDFKYELYPLETIEEFPALLRSDVFGWNVTIPYKSAIITYLNQCMSFIRDVHAGYNAATQFPVLHRIFNKID